MRLLYNSLEPILWLMKPLNLNQENPKHGNLLLIYYIYWIYDIAIDELHVKIRSKKPSPSFTHQRDHLSTWPASSRSSMSISSSLVLHFSSPVFSCILTIWFDKNNVKQELIIFIIVIIVSKLPKIDQHMFLSGCRLPFAFSSGLLPSTSMLGH